MTRTPKSVVLGVVLSLNVAPAVLLSRQQPAKAAAAKTSPVAATQPIDGGWPRAYTTASGAQLLLYQPQIASWVDQKHITGYAAVSYTAKAATKPALGTLKIEADTSVSVPERLVNFSEFTIAEANFSTLPKWPP